VTPSEYQELAEFVAAAFDRQRRETREAIDGLRAEMTVFRNEITDQTRRIVVEETRRIVMVSVEDLRGEIRLVAEGVTANRRRIEENGRRIDALTDRFDLLAVRQDDHEERLDRLERRG
jgi:hypothetical protein